MPPSLRFSAALIHHPVRNRHGEIITATTDEFDFFDAARLSLFFPLHRLYIVQPIPAQKVIVERFLEHGTRPDRDPARGRFDAARLVDTLDDAIADMSQALAPPTVVATTARALPGALSFGELRERIHSAEPVLLLFGKAWGLADSVLEGADAVLAPATGGTGFDHLSVRAAIAIVLDRLLAPSR